MSGRARNQGKRPGGTATARQANLQARGAKPTAIRSPVSSPAVATGPRLSTVMGPWFSTAARVLLGLVLAWFGYHELVAPGLWTGYVPVLAVNSHLAQVLVLVHGWLLLVLAASLVLGVAPRAAAAVTAVLLLEIVLSLWATGGLSDLVLRDVGVLGLALAISTVKEQRLVLTR